MNEYHTEKFIDQYEHIRRLSLLTDEELSHVKKKRNQFEVAIRSVKEPKEFIEYIKYEIALMKKFKQIEYKNENDERALDRAMSLNVKEIFRSALKKFQAKRKIWEYYVSFVKQKFPNIVTNVYQEMLHFHHTKEDYAEVVRHEMSKGNFNVAIAFLIQGISQEKDKDLVVLHIECSLQQAEEEKDEKVRENTLAQASKFYAKFLKSSKEVRVHVDLIQKIQKFEFAMSLQDEILTNMLRAFRERAEVWDVLAKRHLDGLFYNENSEDQENEKNPSTETCLRHALTIYDKSFEYIGEPFRKQMYNLYITKLLELDASSDIMTQQCLMFVRQALGKALSSGYEEESLSEAHFIYCLKLRMIYKEKYQSEIEEMIGKGTLLYPNSMEFFELAIRYYLELKSFENITTLFNFALSNNEKNAVELYKFLCNIYMLDPRDKEKAKSAMIDAIKSSDKTLSEAFQPFFIEYYTLTEGIIKAREMYNSLINSKVVTSLSIDFFKAMLRMEEIQVNPDHKLMINCYERATEHFGKEDPEVRILTFYHISFNLFFN